MIKKLLTVIITALITANLITTLPPQNAKAMQSYGRAITEDVGFYKDANATELLFYLPYTYYVKITEYGASISRAEIFTFSNVTPALDGYVYTDSLYFEDVTPVAPYYELTLTTASTTPFYADSNQNTVLRYVFENRELSFYGSLQTASGSYLYYVCYNGSLGYVKEENVVPFTFVPHPTPLPVFEEQTPTPPTQPETQKGGVDVVKIAIIIALSLAGITIFAFALKPEKKQSEVAFYDDNDYD